MTLCQDFQASPRDQEHLQRLLARLWAAEHALANEIAGGLGISENGALVLARMRIDEVIDSHRGGDDDFVRGYPNESYCARCWALLAPERELVADYERELFETCIYCGQTASAEREWERAA